MKAPYDIALAAAPVPTELDPWALPADSDAPRLVRLRQPPEFARVLQRIFMAMPRVGAADEHEEPAVN